MVAPDAEWYLRRIAEDELLSGAESTLDARGRALVAVDLLDESDVINILQPYERARALRGMASRPRGEPLRVTSAMPDPPSVSRCERTFDGPWGRIRIDYVATCSHLTSIVATVSPSSPGGQPGPVPPLVVKDDRGERHVGEFSADGPHDDGVGSFTLLPSLRPDTPWITMFGHRVELDHHPTDVSVAVEPVPSDLPVDVRAHRHLTFCLEASGGWWTPGRMVPIVAQTFVDLGVLPRDSARWARAAAQALRSGDRATNDIEERWAAVLRRRGRRDGPVGVRAVGAIARVNEQTRISILDLRSTEDDVVATVDVAGAVGAWPGPAHRRSAAFAVSARDDVGNHYLGHLAYEERGRDDGLHERLSLAAPLDPRARHLDMRVATERCAATIGIPLSWSGSS